MEIKRLKQNEIHVYVLMLYYTFKTIVVCEDPVEVVLIKDEQKKPQGSLVINTQPLKVFTFFSNFNPDSLRNQKFLQGFRI